MSRRTNGAALGLVMVASLWGACAEQRVERLEYGMNEVAALRASTARPAQRQPAARPLRALDGRREGGALLLADAAGRRLALIADEDAAALRLVDVATHRQLSSLALPGRPGQLAIGADGRGYVALRDQQQLMAVELADEASAVNNVHESQAGPGARLREVGRFATAAEPIGLAMSPDGDTLLVVSGWGRRLQGLSLKSGATLFSVQLAREPRAVTVSPDGKVAFVSHAVGAAISRVALNDAEHAVTALAVGGTDQHVVNFKPVGCFGVRCGFSGRRRIVGPLVTRHAGQGFALAAFQQGAIAPLVIARTGSEQRPVGGYGTSESFAAHQAALVGVYSDVDEVMVRTDSRMFPASLPQSGSGNHLGRDGCLLPRAIAVDSPRAMALVSCLGNDQLVAIRLDGESLTRATLARWRVPSGPIGVAIDSQAGEAHIWSQFAGKLSTVTLPAAGGRAMVASLLSPPPRALPQRVSSLPALALAEGAPARLSEAARRGRVLFHAAGDLRISADGRACASCHPDGREDGLTWPSPQGRSQTPMLAGRVGADTAPYGWSGESDSLAGHIQHTFQRLGGRGLTGDERTALMAYLQEMPAPPRQLGPATDAAMVARGKALFEQDAVGCAVCHKRGDGSDGATHNVGSGRDLDTPSLRFISGTAPYFHDGRYATLMDVLRETKGKMGWGGDLSEQDLLALNAYLLSL